MVYLEKIPLNIYIRLDPRLLLWLLRVIHKTHLTMEAKHRRFCLNCKTNPKILKKVHINIKTNNH